MPHFRNPPQWEWPKNRRLAMVMDKVAIPQRLLPRKRKRLTFLSYFRFWRRCQAFF